MGKSKFSKQVIEALKEIEKEGICPLESALTSKILGVKFEKPKTKILNQISFSDIANALKNGYEEEKEMSKVKISAELAHALETLIEWDISGYDNERIIENVKLMKESEFEYSSQELLILNDTNMDLIEEALLNGYEVYCNLEDIKKDWKYKEPCDTPVKHINRKINYQKMKKEVDFLKTLGYDELEVINCKKEGIEWKLKEIDALNKATLDELQKFFHKYFKEDVFAVVEDLTVDDLLDLYNISKLIGNDEWREEILEKLENRSG